MSTTAAGVVFIVSLVVAIAVAYRPFGDYMYLALHPKGNSRLERGIYKVIGVNPDGEQSWGVYARSVLAFSAVSILFLYLFQRVQDKLWLNLGFPPVKADQAWNTAVSFTTNTNWQSYSGESTMGHLVQMAGLAVQNFASAAVGVAVAVALVRGLARTRTNQLGNFWVDLVRITVRILLPIAVVGAVVFIAAGMVQNLSVGTDVSTLAGGTQHVTGGPVASQEVIKEFGTNGGGFYNANSSHPFENPTTWTNWIQIFLILLIPFSLPRVFGRMVGQNRQGCAIAAIMAILAIGSIVTLNALQLAHDGTVPTAVGAATEGTESRFGVAQSVTFAAATTLTSTGAVDSFHDSYTALGGGVTMFNMMLGEVAPGGTGSGLYGLLILAVITVFVAGLMVGRTPEYLGKKIGAREMKFASLLSFDHAGPGARRHRHRDVVGHRPGVHAQLGCPRTVRSALCVHVGQQQQRFSLRRHQCQHAVLQHRHGSVHAGGKVPAHDLRAGSGRRPGRSTARARVSGHAADLQAAVRWHGCRRHAHRLAVMPDEAALEARHLSTDDETGQDAVVYWAGSSGGRLAGQ